MLKAVGQYVWDEARPRAWRIIFSAHVAIALVLGGTVYKWGQASGLPRLKIAEVSSSLLTYGAVVLGFSLAGLTIALTLPDRAFAKSLATSNATRQNAYSDLLFVFSWTALVHWFILVIALGCIVILGSDHEILAADATRWQRALVGGLSATLFYGVCQFLVTLITLSQVGQVYIDSLRSKDK